MLTCLRHCYAWKTSTTLGMEEIKKSHIVVLSSIMYEPLINVIEHYILSEPADAEEINRFVGASCSLM